ncbi:hypothetical protein [Kitasatospora sp. NPDC005748]|uniref:hypothetical protein n=1 Tax=Kitasatospora sp. NPDC005748 TaxID=3157063 RepID=UPI0033EE132E
MLRGFLADVTGGACYGGEADVLPVAARELDAAEGRPADARALLDESAELAAGAGAKAVLHSIDEARAEL